LRFTPVRLRRVAAVPEGSWFRKSRTSHNPSDSEACRYWVENHERTSEAVCPSGKPPRAFEVRVWVSTNGCQDKIQEQAPSGASQSQPHLFAPAKSRVLLTKLPRLGVRHGFLEKS